MPSSRVDLDPRRVPKCELIGEPSATWPLDSIRSDIQRLTLRRRDVYAEAEVHRRGGHLVPASLCEELSENGLELRWVIDRYAQERRGTAGLRSVRPERLARP